MGMQSAACQRFCSRLTGGSPGGCKDGDEGSSAPEMKVETSVGMRWWPERRRGLPMRSSETLWRRDLVWPFDALCEEGRGTPTRRAETSRVSELSDVRVESCSPHELSDLSGTRDSEGPDCPELPNAGWQEDHRQGKLAACRESNFITGFETPFERPHATLRRSSTRQR